MWDNLAPMGVVGTIKQILKQPGDSIRILVGGSTAKNYGCASGPSSHGARRGLLGGSRGAGYGENRGSILRAVKETFGEYVEMAPKMAPDIVLEVQTTDDPGYLADYITANIMMEYQDKIDILCELHP